MVCSLRNRRRLLALPDGRSGSQEGEVTSGSGYQVVQPTITDLREDATNLAEIKMHEQRKQFFAKPSPVSQDFWIWLRELREAKALGRIVVAESLANADQEIKGNAGNASSQVTELARLVEQSNKYEQSRRDMSTKKLDGVQGEGESEY